MAGVVESPVTNENGAAHRFAVETAEILIDAVLVECIDNGVTMVE